MGPIWDPRRPRNWGRGRWRRPLATDWRAPGMTWGHGWSKRWGFSLRNVAIIVWILKIVDHPMGKTIDFWGYPYFKKPSHDLEYHVESDVSKSSLCLMVFHWHWPFKSHDLRILRVWGTQPGAARNGSQPTAMLKLIEVYYWDLMIDLHLYQQMTPHITTGYRFSLPTWSTRPGSLWAAHPSPTQDGFVPKKKRKSSGKWSSEPEDGMGYPGIQVSLFSKYPKNVCPKKNLPLGRRITTYFNHQKAYVPWSQRRKHVVISHKAQDIP